MSKFSRVKKVLSLIVGITNFNLMNVEAVKKVKREKMNPGSKAVFGAKKTVLKKKHVGVSGIEKKVNPKGAKNNKKKIVGAENVKSLKKNVKMSSSRRNRALRSLHRRKVAQKTNGGYFVDKDGNIRWRNVGITSAWGVPTTAVVGTGVVLGAEKLLGSSNPNQYKPAEYNNKASQTFININESSVQTSSSSENLQNPIVLPGVTNKEIVHNGLDSDLGNTNQVFDQPVTQAGGGENPKIFPIAASQYLDNNSAEEENVVNNLGGNLSFGPQNGDDAPAESYDEALAIVKEAFESEKPPKGNPVRIKASFKGSGLDGNSGKGYEAANNVYHSKRPQHNLKLFLWRQLPKCVLRMSANEFEVWLALKLLENENLEGDFFGHEFVFGTGKDKVGLKLKRDYNIEWNLGQDVGLGVQFGYGKQSMSESTRAGVISKGEKEVLEFSTSGKTAYGKITFVADTAELAYKKQLESAVRACMNWDTITIGEKGGFLSNGWTRTVDGNLDSPLKHLRELGRGKYQGVVKSILDTLCSKNAKLEGGKVKFSASNRVKMLKKDKKATNFLRMLSLIRYFAVYVSTGYTVNGFLDGAKQLLSALAFAMIDKLYVLDGGESALVAPLLKACGGILDPKDMINYGLGTLYEDLGDAGGGCRYIG